MDIRVIVNELCRKELASIKRELRDGRRMIGRWEFYSQGSRSVRPWKRYMSAEGDWPL